MYDLNMGSSIKLKKYFNCMPEATSSGTLEKKREKKKKEKKLYQYKFH